ncbi:MAG: ABC transporter permease [Coprobacillus sp.]
MNNVLRAELYKLKNNKTFYLCMLVAIGVSIVGTVTTTDENATYMFLSVATNLPIFLAITVSDIVCNDYEENTMKNLISSGNSRWHIYGGKLIAALIVGVIFFAVDGVASTISGYIFNGFGHGVTALHVMESLAVQLLLIAVYVLTFFGFSAIAKTSKVGLIASLIYIFAVALIPWALSNYVFHVNLSAFSMDTLIKNIENLNFSYHMIINFVIYGSASILFNIIGYLRFKREEV